MLKYARSFRNIGLKSRLFGTYCLLGGLLAQTLLCSCVLSQEMLRAGEFRLQPALQFPWRASLASEPQLLQQATLLVKMGREARPLSLGRAEKRLGMYIFRPDFPLRISLQPYSVARCLVWRVSCRNLHTEPIWLEIGPQLHLQFAARAYTIFEGWEDVDSPQGPIVSTRLEGNMPLVCAWQGRATVAVGLEPSQLVSYLRHEFEPKPNRAARLACVTRIVVDPGREESLRFVLIGAPGEWGKYEVFEAYYDSFPNWFCPHSNVDRRLCEGSTQYLAWPAGPWTPEMARRLYGGWEWCYAPFRRTGDIVGRKELWDYQPARPPDKTRALPREEFLRWRKERFQDGTRRCDVAMMFYIPAQIWCEETLARERYVDALITDPKQKTYFNTPWVTGHDNELRVFPLETSFGCQSYADMAQIAEELDIAGFAFDTAGGAARYTGPALAQLPHRAWDEQLGVYCGENVAIAKLMDYVHTLQKQGRPLGVVANPMAYGTYMSCFHADSAMLERNPWSTTRTESDRLRWKMGHKTLVWWEDYDVQDFVDIQTISREQLIAIYKGLADFTLLQSLRVGYIPTPNFTLGMAKLVRWLPAIVECVQTGWEPVPAAHCPAPLWATRYGKGLRTLLAVAHETGQPVEGDILIDNKRLGAGVYLFSRYDGSARTNRVTKGQTCIRLQVPVRTPELLRAQLNIIPAEAVQEARVEAHMGLSQGTLRAVLKGNGSARLIWRLPSDMTLAAAKANGKPLAPKVDGDAYASCSLKLAGQTEFVAQFTSTLFQLPEEQLVNFPFVKEGQPNCVIVLSAPHSAAQQHAAFRLQEYFRYWYGRAVQPPVEVRLPIVTGQMTPEQASRPIVYLRLKPQEPARVQLSSQKDLLISAPTEEALRQTMFAVLRALDKKYWFPERLRATALHQRTGLAEQIVE